MHILVDNGAYTMRNMGDVAMLQACVSRIRLVVPAAQITVFCTNPELLGRYCQDVRALPVSSRDATYEPGRITASNLVEKWLALKRTLAKTPAEAHQFQQAFSSADAVVVAGGGFLNDLNPLQTRPVLRMLLDAAKKGRRTALFSQGLGPLENPEFLSLLGQACRAGTMVALRESRRGPGILRAAGAGADCSAVTGDDAVEMAWSARPVQVGTGLGFSLRQVDYAALQDTDFQAVTRALSQLKAQTGAKLIPVPISFNASENDPVIIGRVAGAEAAAEAATLDSPAALISQAAKCRVLVTGTYHAGVFALSQGVPAVCLYRSPYYRDKMQGLAAQFGDGCELINLAEEDAATRIFAAAERLWQTGEQLRDGLLARAEAQVRAADSFYRRALG
ncbi:MAG TPA: polysaccharide pyruvyl transferase family protein [Clostridia bacterium]|nr:polysaccharide pyruvyl transferase family protein [Clostridia bacterium]